MSDSKQAETVRSWFSGRPVGPCMIQLNPTMACNLNCLFCRRQDGFRDSHMNNRELSDRKYLEIIDDAIALGTRAINIKGGGEPLLRRSLMKQMIPKIKQGGMSGSLITNGTFIDEELTDIFVKNEWEEISISLDGPDAKTQDYIRDKAGTFDLIMAFIGRINHFKKRYGRRLPWLRFHLVLTNRNCRSLDRWIRLAYECRAEEVEVDSLDVNQGSAKPLALGPEDVEAFQGKLHEWVALAEKFGLRHNLKNFFRVEHVQRSEKNIANEDNPFLKTPWYFPWLGAKGMENPVLKIPCFFPWFHVSITSQGRMVPCCYGEWYNPHFDLHQATFKEAWLDLGMREYREAMEKGAMMPFCKNCTADYIEHNGRIRTLLLASANQEKARA